MKYKFYNIKWDTDGQSHNLPSEYLYSSPMDEFDVENEGADVLSDEFGYCVFSFEYEKL